MRSILKSLIGFIFILSACHSPNPSSQNKQEKILRISIEGEPPSLDPQRASDLNSLNLIRLLFDGLVRMNLQETVELALADKIEISEDLKTYTFRLKEAFWTNGISVKASDFTYAWKKALSPHFPSPTAFHMYPIKNAKAVKEGRCSSDELGVFAVDEKTLKVELEEPTPYFLELLALPVYFPISQKEDEKNPHWNQESFSYIGNGPFALKEWKHHDQIVLVKNTRYWDSKVVKIPRIQIFMIRGDTAYNMFEKNELDWAGSPISMLPLDTLPSLKQKKQLETKPFLGTAFLRINTSKAPFGHALFRKAFAFSIDRKALVEHVTQGGQEPAVGLVPTKMGLQKTPYFPDADPLTARSVLARGMKQTDLDWRNFPEITLTFISRERGYLIAQTLQQQWFNAFGIRVKLDAVEAKVFFERVAKGDYQLAYSDWTADFNDPLTFLEIFKYKKNGSNYTHWESDEYIQSLNLASRVVDQDIRKEMLAHSEKILMEEMPIIPLYHYTLLFIRNHQLTDVALSSLGSIDFKWASLQPTKEVGELGVPR